MFDIKNIDEYGVVKSEALRKYKLDIKKCKVLKPKIIQGFFEKIGKTDDIKKIQKYKMQIFNSYLKKIIEISKTYIDISLVQVDLIQEGNIALLESIDSYIKDDIHIDFDTYVIDNIKHTIEFYIKENPVFITHDGLKINIIKK